MKTIITLFEKKKMATIFVALAALALTIQSCKKDDATPVNNNPYTVTGNAAGSQVVPAVSGTGTGTMTGTYDPASRTLNYTSNWNGLTGAPTSGGFYNGASGTTGTAVGTPWTFKSDATGTGSTTGTMTLTSDQATQLTSGNWYYGYGTAANTGGEVRGQMSAAQ